MWCGGSKGRGFYWIASEGKDTFWKIENGATGRGWWYLPIHTHSLWFLLDFLPSKIHGDEIPMYFPSKQNCYIITLSPHVALDPEMCWMCYCGCVREPDISQEIRNMYLWMEYKHWGFFRHTLQEDKWISVSSVYGYTSKNLTFANNNLSYLQGHTSQNVVCKWMLCWIFCSKITF